MAVASIPAAEVADAFSELDDGGPSTRRPRWASLIDNLAEAATAAEFAATNAAATVEAAVLDDLEFDL